jgi:hypothetical protein
MSAFVSAVAEVLAFATMPSFKFGIIRDSHAAQAVPSSDHAAHRTV